ncbi:hypothetical protein HD596_011872 [Nonomuraea jabiensis]|uniref:Uncharacterized protein n=1 Tax=Nonomuraea jabiensis TaxID=882448 RepID=A0A7W9GK00_9ACTN|nr:hypothetical protein [Nonomuraea jabiensis]
MAWLARWPRRPRTEPESAEPSGEGETIVISGR